MKVGYVKNLRAGSSWAVCGLVFGQSTMYINDKNSSTLREFITVGYNGYKQSVYGEPLMCEAKPQNVRSINLLWRLKRR